MRLSSNSVLNISFVTGFFLACCSIQTILWYQLFGQAPAPLLWVLITLYILITRETYSALMIVYFLTFLASRFSTVTLGYLIPSMAMLCAFVLTFRSRIFWRGSSYFFLVGSHGLLLFHVLSTFVSLIVESNSTGFLFIDRVVQIMISIGFIFPIFSTMRWIDRTFQYHGGFGTGDLV
jgi:hypothetical protein